MKTLIILSACLLALSSCTKEMPVPDPDPYPVYIFDPDADPDTPPDDNNDDDSDDDGDDPSPYCYNNHPGSTTTWMAATSFNPLG